jgi:hypothetical protein
LRHWVLKKVVDEYERLADRLAVDGIRCHHQSPDQLVISRQEEPVWPDDGNSFWVTRAGGEWHLFTWTQKAYSIPETADVASICRTCIAHGNSAMYAVPAELQERLGLREVDEDEMACIFAQMAKPDG